ncbi:MAG: hypothetical protein AAF958_16635 [Planctomycetota bacterium]
MVRIEPRAHWSLVTVSNWNEYQKIGSPKNEAFVLEKQGRNENSGPDSGQARNNQRSGKEQPSNNQGTQTTTKNNQEPPKQVSSSRPTKGRKTLRFTSKDRALAQRIADAVLTVTPHSKVNLDRWSNDDRLMREADRIDHDTIWRVFDWANHDDFWRPNVLSVAKLRKQFATLSAKAIPSSAPDDDDDYGPGIPLADLVSDGGAS